MSFWPNVTERIVTKALEMLISSKVNDTRVDDCYFRRLAASLEDNSNFEWNSDSKISQAVVKLKLKHKLKYKQSQRDIPRPLKSNLVVSNQLLGRFLGKIKTWSSWYSFVITPH